MICQCQGRTRKTVLGLTLLLIFALYSTSHAREQSNAHSKSQFLEELNKEKAKYKDTEAPAAAVVFRWDFSNKSVHTYSYEQEVRIMQDMGGFEKDPHEIQQKMSAKGTLSINSQGDGTADLVLKDMKMIMEMDLESEEEPKPMEQTIPPIVLQGMKEDGSGSFSDSSQEMFLKMLFPLPTVTVQVGESVDVPAQMPFNAMGSLLYVKGRSRITLTRYVKIGQRTCAQLDVDIDISDLKVPAELVGEYECSTKGAAVFYFDVTNRCFVSGTTAILMHLSIDAPMPEMNIPEEEMPQMPERLQMSMMSDNLIRVSLTE